MENNRTIGTIAERVNFLQRKRRLLGLPVSVNKRTYERSLAGDIDRIKERVLLTKRKATLLKADALRRRKADLLKGKS